MDVSLRAPAATQQIPRTEAKFGDFKALTDHVVPAPMPDLPAPGVVGPEGGFPLVEISDVPAERMSQLVGFFQRNPGSMKTGPVADAVRGAVGDLPVLGAVARFTEPADVGYGQAIRDQTAWQMASGRQPNNRWWLAMNKGLVQDPLTAEAAVRTGRTNELTTKSQLAWARYVELGDKVKRVMGLAPEATEFVTPEGEHQPLALSDAWKGVSLVKRAYVQLVLKPDVREALWKGHRETLEDRRPKAMQEAIALGREAPEEMEMSSGWASIIGVYSHFNPLVTGSQSDLAQRLILPMQHPVDDTDQPWGKRLFAKLLDAIDTRYERDIVPAIAAADAADAAAAAS